MIRLLLKLLFGNMQSGQIEHRRIFHKFDMAKNRTIIIVAGPLDAHRLEGAKEVLKGESHARRFAKRKVKGGPEMILLERMK